MATNRQPEPHTGAGDTTRTTELERHEPVAEQGQISQERSEAVPVSGLVSQNGSPQLSATANSSTDSCGMIRVKCQQASQNSTPKDVTETNLPCPREPILNENSPRDSGDGDADASAGSSSGHSSPWSPWCYVCHNTEEGRMIEPCVCVGRLAQVHETCLSKWIEISRTERCNICNERFNVITKGFKPLSQWQCPETNRVDVVHILLLAFSFFVFLFSAGWLTYIGTRVTFNVRSAYSVFIYIIYSLLTIICSVIIVYETKQTLLPKIRLFWRINHSFAVATHKIKRRQSARAGEVTVTVTKPAPCSNICI